MWVQALESLGNSESMRKLDASIRTTGAVRKTQAFLCSRARSVASTNNTPFVVSGAAQGIADPGCCGARAKSSCFVGDRDACLLLCRPTARIPGAADLLWRPLVHPIAGCLSLCVCTSSCTFMTMHLCL